MKFYRHRKSRLPIVLGLKADGHNVGCYAGTAAGIVLPAVGNNRVPRHHRQPDKSNTNLDHCIE
jgi:hypothetical protein